MWLDQISPVLRRMWRGAFHEGFVEPARYLFDHELVLFTEGECTVNVEGREMIRRAGDYMIVPPGLCHTTLANRGRVYRVCMHFDWAYDDADDTDLPICTYHPTQPDPRRVRLRPAFVPAGVFIGRFDVHPVATVLAETISTRWFFGGALDRITARAVLTELLLVLLAPVSPEASKPKEKSVRDLAIEVKQALDDDTIAPNDSIQDFLQRRMGLSYAHVCRIFRKTFGVPPVHYLNRLRIERAKVMLADPRHDVATVARAVGFTDPGYFSRIFRRIVGVSPRRYTRLVQ